MTYIICNFVIQLWLHISRVGFFTVYMFVHFVKLCKCIFTYNSTEFYSFSAELPELKFIPKHFENYGTSPRSKIIWTIICHKSDYSTTTRTKSELTADLQTHLSRLGLRHRLIKTPLDTLSFDSSKNVHFWVRRMKCFIFKWISFN